METWSQLRGPLLLLIATTDLRDRLATPQRMETWAQLRGPLLLLIATTDLSDRLAKQKK